MRLAALGLAIFVAAPAARAAADGAAPAVSSTTTTDPATRYQSEGQVVHGAASFIGVMTVIPAAVVGAVACPVKLASGKAPADKTYQQRYKDCVAAGTASGSQFFYTVGGYPFLLLKRVFWDAPRRALRGSVAPKKDKPADSGR